MEGLDLQQLELLIYIFIGLVTLTLLGLFIYVVISVRRRGAQVAAPLYDSEDLVVRPSFLVVGQVLALVREGAGEPIRVEIEGTRYRSLGEVRDPQIRRQIVDAAMELIQFTGVLGDEADLDLAPSEKTETWREDMRTGSEVELELARQTAPGKSPQAPPPADREVEEQFLQQLSEMGQAPASVEKPTLTSSIQRALRPKLPDSEQPRTFVDEIEQIVQRRIQLIPVLVGRGLHVRPGSGGEVLFTFEGQEYKKLDDIPNLTARQVIKEAIQEWDELS